MKKPTRTILLASVLSFAIAGPAWSDTLVLRSGTTFSGTLIAADRDTITFTERSGETHRYPVSDVEAIQFGDYQNSSASAPPSAPDYRPPYSSASAPPAAPAPDYRPPYGENDRGRRDEDRGRNFDREREEHLIVPAGAEVAVRTNERIDSQDATEGEWYSAQLESDLYATDGSIAVPRGAEVRLMTRRIESNGDLTLDVQSIMVQGQRYRVNTGDTEIENRQGIGANKRTGEFIGGGTAFGAIIGAIAGGGKGAAIGAISGAGAGAAAQMITRGHRVFVPAESVLRFRLDQPLKLTLWP